MVDLSESSRGRRSHSTRGCSEGIRPQLCARQRHLPVFLCCSILLLLHCSNVLFFYSSNVNETNEGRKSCRSRSSTKGYSEGARSHLCARQRRPVICSIALLFYCSIALMVYSSIAQLLSCSFYGSIGLLLLHCYILLCLYWSIDLFLYCFIALF